MPHRSPAARRRSVLRASIGALASLVAAVGLFVVGPVADATTAAAHAAPRTTLATATGGDPVITPGLEWVAHRDNPFRQGDDPDYINSDLAFSGDHLIIGNYDGFSVWDIADPLNPELRSAYECPGGQGDVSAVGSLVVLSVDETMSSSDCDAYRVPETTANWEGIRIFDISDPADPKYVTSVQTRCGSHTHTLVPDPTDPRVVYVYVSAYSRGASLNCTGRNPLQIIRVPLDAPEQAAIAGELDLFDDSNAFGPGDRPAGGADTRYTTGCHDITAYPAKQLAVAACRGDGLLLSIADPLHPTVLQRMRDANVAFWHSGIFNNEGNAVVFQDELGDAFINTCSTEFGTDRGADALWTMDASGTLVHQSYFKIARQESDDEKCVAHSGGLIPVPDRFIIAQSWLEGGVSVIDFTDPAAPVELAYFDRPSYGYSMPYTAGIWAVYYYDGYLYASDTYEGLEVLRLTDPMFADAARYAPGEFNPQTQPEYSWVWRQAPVVPADAAARAALTPLVMTPAIAPEGSSPTVEVSLPPGSLEPDDTVDVWWIPTRTVLATTKSAADGSLPATAVQVPGPLAAGGYDLVARGDRSADRPALGELEIEAPPPTPGPGAAGGDESGARGWLIALIVVLGVLAVLAAAAAVLRFRAVRRRTATRGVRASGAEIVVDDASEAAAEASDEVSTPPEAGT